MDLHELLWAGADEQARALRDGRVSAPGLLEAVLDRIAATEPRLNAFRTVYAASARAEAAAAQRRIDGGESTPLLGVPVAVKDDQDVAGDATGIGGRPQLPPPTADSVMVARLRAAGAVIVGRTHVPERMQWPFTETLTYGATRNPWSLDHTPGGSSGGTGAALAAGVVGVATGSDGGGSIRIPSACCGLFGVKTTRGLVTVRPGVEGWHGLSVAGPIGRRVVDAAAMLDVVAEGAATAGTDAAAGDASDAGSSDAGSYVAAAGADPGRLRIALAWRAARGSVRIEEQRRAAVRETADRLRALGHDVVEREIPLGPEVFGQFVVRLLRGVADDVASLPHPEWLEPRTRASRRLGSLIPDALLARVRRAEDGLHARMRPFFDEFDVVLQPGMADAPWEIGHFHGRGSLATLLGAGARMPHMPTWNVLGYPSAAVPVGRDRDGLPMSVQLVGPPHAERRLLSLAGQLERDRPWADDRPPAFA